MPAISGPTSITVNQPLTIPSPVSLGAGNKGAVQVGNNSPYYLQVDVGSGKQLLPPLASANYALPAGQSQIVVTAVAPGTGTAPTGAPHEVFATFYGPLEPVPPPIPLPPILSVPVVALPADQVVVATSTTPVVGTMLSGDTADRATLDPSGLLLGDGTVRDVRFGRAGTNRALITPTLEVPGEIRSVGIGGVPRLYLKATDSVADSKTWDVLPFGSTLLFRAINDAENSALTWMTATRAGISAVDVTLSGSLLLGGGVQLVQGTGAIRDRATGGRTLYHDSADVYVGDIDNLGRDTIVRAAGVDNTLFTAAGQQVLKNFPGTTHQSNAVASAAQIIGGRGFAVNADSQAYQGGVTAGVSVAISRAAPASSFNNAGGPAIVGYEGATQMFEVGQLSTISVDQTNLKIGWSDGTPRFNRVIAIPAASVGGAEYVLCVTTTS